MKYFSERGNISFFHVHNVHSVDKREISLTVKIFCEINSLVTSLVKTLLSLLLVHCTAVWKLQKFFLTHFDKNFVKVTVLLKKLLKS